MLVTGASGAIGSACARAFAAEGARLIVHYNRGEDRARALAEELGGVTIAQADLTVEADVERLFAVARGVLGRVDVCVEVQGAWPREDVPVWDLPLQRWEETLRTNLTATFLVARAFLREVQRHGHGSLVLVGSTAGVFGEAGHADYASAKSAILGGLLLSLKNEIVRIAPLGRVNAVAPGWTESPMTRGLIDPKRIRAVSRTMALRKVAQRIRAVSRTMALRKVAQPEDVAAQVVRPRVRQHLQPCDRTGRRGCGRYGRPNGSRRVKERLE